VISGPVAGTFLSAQILGGILGGLMVMGCVPVELWKNVPGPEVGEGIRPETALASEAIASFLLVYVIFSTLFDRRFPRTSVPSSRTAIEICVHLFGGAFSGGLCNPAVALGMAVVTGDWAAQWIYWVGPLLGAFFGGVAYYAVIPKEQRAANNQPSRSRV
jgi:glycerol uptake facilitator-like aquaporin